MTHQIGVIMKDQITNYISSQYGSLPEKLWAKYPNYVVFRHNSNRKWFAIIMDVPYYKLGIDSDKIVNIINVKTENLLFRDLLLSKKGYFKAYHMNKEKWISILLDGSVPFEEICDLLNGSYNLTK